MPEIEARNLRDIWIQQDGATCHTARKTMDLLRSRFGEKFISRLGPVDWPPRSPRASHSKLVFTDGRIKTQLRPTFERGYL